MKWRIFLLSSLFLVSAASSSSAAGLREDSQLWEMWGNSQMFLATDFGLERFTFSPTKPGRGITRVASAEGSGQRPIDLDILTGEDAVVLTTKTVDYYTFSRKGYRVGFVNKVELRKEFPIDLERANTNLVMVIYKTGVEMFGLNYGREIYSIDNGIAHSKAVD
ncbi:hypothetical protein ACFLRA_02400 [Bdellovibrionota bacterium]